jgi:Predicted endonuclease involved in recombination (possible Holliday junction resolvase in Mycoplasmas and B. subtilis)
MSLGSKTVLAVDPGTAKCGLALVRRNADGSIELLWHKIAQAEDFCDALEEAARQAEFSMVIVGSGTASRRFVERLRESMPSVGILVVDERDTTMQARERYWEHNPRRGWRRLLPATMWVPPVPIDDYAALVLAERVLTE